MFIAAAVTASTATGILAAMRPPPFGLPRSTWPFLRVPLLSGLPCLSPPLWASFVLPTNGVSSWVPLRFRSLPAALAGTAGSETCLLAPVGDCSAFLSVGEDSIMDFYTNCKKNIWNNP